MTADAALSVAAFEAVADHLNDLVAIFDPTGRCTYLNRTGRRLLRIEPAAPLPALMLADVPAASERERFEAVLKAVAEGDTWAGAVAISSPVTGEFPTRSTICPVDMGAAGRGTAWVARDTTTDRDVIRSLRERAFYDHLTGLPHRSLFLDRLDLLLRRSTGETMPVGLLFLSPDRFKERVNRFEQVVVEMLLKSVAQRLTERMLPGESVHRWGDEDFVVLLEQVEDERVARIAAERMAAAFHEPFQLGELEVFMTVSVGIALGNPGETTTDELRRHAESAGQLAKSQGNGTLRLFDSDLRRRALRRAELEDALRGASGRGELVLFYQPEVLLRTNQIVACEALLRWRHPDWGLVAPDEFIPVAESSNLILEIGAWVASQAFRQCADWARRYPHRNPVSVAVNISGRQFAQESFEDTILAHLDESGVDPRSICLEITESVLLDDAEETVAKLHRLKRLGVKLAIDDFGTGYSSLSYLRRFPIDILKVDQAFVAGLGHDPEDSAIVHAVVRMGQALDMTTLAEGVETAHHVIELRELQCDLAQGYHFARPLPADQFGQLLDAGDDWLDSDG